jgi:pentatricopeptide repeat protein
MAADALELYRRMPSELIVEKTHVCVLNACSHSGFVNEARLIFQNIRVKDKWTYTAMVRNVFNF